MQCRPLYSFVVHLNGQFLLVMVNKCEMCQIILITRTVCINTSICINTCTNSYKRIHCLRINVQTYSRWDVQQIGIDLLLMQHTCILVLIELVEYKYILYTTRVYIIVEYILCTMVDVMIKLNVIILYYMINTCVLYTCIIHVYYGMMA